jgi:RNA polymerase sigma-70 factor (ECF subfamily)
MTTPSVTPSEFDITPGLLRLRDGESDRQQIAVDSVAAFADIDALYATYHGRIFRFLLVSLRNREYAESLTQDTFLRAWTARARFRGDCAPATWLMRIAINLLRDHTRSRRLRFWQHAELIDASEFEGQIAVPESGSEAQLIANQQVAHLWATVAQLPLQQRTVFTLRFAEEMELHEIAAATGRPLSTVKSHLYRSLAAVRKAQQIAPPCDSPKKDKQPERTSKSKTYSQPSDRSIAAKTIHGDTGQ